MSHKLYSLPVVPYLETRSGWEPSMTEEADPVFSFSHRPVRAGSESGLKLPLDRLKVDAFEVRDALFAIENAGQARAFFQAYGPWQIKQRLSNEAGTIRMSGLLRQMDFFQDALLTQKIDTGQLAIGDEAINKAFEDFYLWQPLPMEMVFQQTPFVVVPCKDIQDALRASVFLDKVEGFPLRRCVREGCGKVFRLEHKHTKVYCSPVCAHLQASRDYNERKRYAALKVQAQGQAAKTRAASRKSRKGRTQV